MIKLIIIHKYGPVCMSDTLLITIGLRKLYVVGFNINLQIFFFLYTNNCWLSTFVKFFLNLH